MKRTLFALAAERDALKAELQDAEDRANAFATYQMRLATERNELEEQLDEALNQLDSARHSVAVLSRRLKKKAAFVYPDTSYGSRVPCNFTVLHKSPLDVMAVFQEQFQMVNDRSEPPVAVALFIGDNIVTSVCLKELGLYAALYQGDTITVSPLPR